MSDLWKIAEDAFQAAAHDPTRSGKECWQAAAQAVADESDAQFATRMGLERLGMDRFRQRLVLHNAVVEAARALLDQEVIGKTPGLFAYVTMNSDQAAAVRRFKLAVKALERAEKVKS